MASSSALPPATSADAPKGALEAHLTRFAHSPWPAYALGGLFLSSVPFHPHLAAPPLAFRIAFGAIFAGTGWMTSTGDVRNGNGATTAWALTYSFLYFRSAFRRTPSETSSPIPTSAPASTPKPSVSIPKLRPRDRWSILLALATTGVGAVYGSNYFVFKDFGKEAGVREDEDE